jgi:hypothetical protein
MPFYDTPTHSEYKTLNMTNRVTEVSKSCNAIISNGLNSLQFKPFFIAQGSVYDNVLCYRVGSRPSRGLTHFYEFHYGRKGEAIPIQA